MSLEHPQNMYENKKSQNTTNMICKKLQILCVPEDLEAVDALRIKLKKTMRTEHDKKTTNRKHKWEMYFNNSRAQDGAVFTVLPAPFLERKGPFWVGASITPCRNVVPCLYVEGECGGETWEKTGRACSNGSAGWPWVSDLVSITEHRRKV